MRTMILLLMVCCAFALDDMSTPYSFSANTLIRSANFNENNDSIRIPYNKLLDSLENFVRHSDMNDSTFDTIRTNAIRSNPDIDSMSGNPVMDSADMGYLDSDTIAAFTLTGKLTGGSNEIEGSGFDINGGAIDGVTIGGSAAPTVTDLGSVTTCDINGGTVDGVTIGGSAAPTVTDLGSVTTCDINGGTVDGVTIGGSAAPTVTDLGSVTTCDINGGTVDGVTIGGSVAPTVTDLGTVTTCDIDGGTLDGVTIGGNTINAGLTWSAAQDLNSQALTNVDINSGTIDGVTSIAVDSIQLSSGTWLKAYIEESFVCTLNGINSTITGTAYYTKIGNMITIEIPALVGTSDSTGTSISGFPSDIRYTNSPNSSMCAHNSVVDNNVLSWGNITPDNDGTWPVTYEGGAWTNSGTKQVNQHYIHYIIQ